VLYLPSRLSLEDLSLLGARLLALALATFFEGIRLLRVGVLTIEDACLVFEAVGSIV